MFANTLFYKYLRRKKFVYGMTALWFARKGVNQVRNGKQGIRAGCFPFLVERFELLADQGTATAGGACGTGWPAAAPGAAPPASMELSSRDKGKSGDGGTYCAGCSM
jgi:hypothetical protein